MLAVKHSVFDLQQQPLREYTLGLLKAPVGAAGLPFCTLLLTAFCLAPDAEASLLESFGVVCDCLLLVIFV